LTETDCVGGVPPSSTRATSLMRTALSPFDLHGASPIVFTRSGSRSCRRWRRTSGAMNSPAGRSAFELGDGARDVLGGDVPRLGLAGSTTTLICRIRPPSGAALATPEMPSRSGSMLLNA
jgi:hypothetical protein